MMNKISSYLAKNYYFNLKQVVNKNKNFNKFRLYNKIECKKIFNIKQHKEDNFINHQFA